MIPKKPVIFVTASTGWAVRNFLQTGALQRLTGSFDFVIFTTATLRKGIEAQQLGGGMELVVVEELDEPLLMKVFRQIKKKLYMEGRKSSTEKIWETHTKRPLYQQVGGVLIRWILRMISWELLFRYAENIDFALNRGTSMRKHFIERNPALFFATHASTFFEEMLLRAAVETKTKTAFMILSWDHLSSKIVLSKKYDKILVWNKLTKDELLETYRGYTQDQIEIVGVPQYDPYAEKPQLNYTKWCELYGLNPAKRTVLFSTMPQVRHEQQDVIIERILKAIQEGKELPCDLQVLVRTHPFDNSDKYDRFLGHYPVGMCKTTLKPNQSQQDWVPERGEIGIARDCLYYCAVNVNIFSTVTIEAAYFNKPIVHIAFDPEPPKNRIPCRHYYNFDHFIKITESRASTLVENFSEMFAAIRKGLEEPEAQATERRKLVEEYLSISPGHSVNMVADCLATFARC